MIHAVSRQRDPKSHAKKSTSLGALALKTLAAGACVALVAGCGSSSSTAGGSGGSTPAATLVAYTVSDCNQVGTPKPATADLPGGVSLDGVTVVTKTGTVPIVSVAATALPVTKLETKDLIVGTGATVKTGDTVTINYCGLGQQSKAVFDSSWARGEPANFPLAQLIEGWQVGIPGMKVGGSRLLIIPGEMGYGPAGSPPKIGANETLYFVVNVLSVP